MRTSRVLASAAILPLIMGMAHLAPASAAPVSAAQLKLLAGNQSANVQSVHCRRFVHVHRRCVVWRAGVCRRWVKYRHRCG
jgi:hypothetical protein